MPKTKTYKKPKKAKRLNHDHGGVPQLAARIGGISVWTVYGVIYGRFTSAPAARAIKEAERQLRQASKKAA